ncbi:hypothetical protein [Paenibacillus ottowii]|uniref:Uncharacterized protein n=1 Tax=Paenibacillus ottowii TaxID=2315729 RepID=A0ABY3B7J4_9BACL|nr:hypothetical protein [Paenibacillus ottowii]TQS00038.1 hypothetical protein FKV70_04445 [Paenibacillus ottowii]TQS00107.1 hypothetical protein FKV70_04820 [Paenibacillus ottowii]
MEIPKGLADYLYQYRIRDFLKKNGKTHSGKPSAYERLNNALMEDNTFIDTFKDFVVEEINYGRNRQIFICNFAVESLSVLGSYRSVQSNLAARSLPFENFNDLMSVDSKAGDMVYLNVEQLDDQVKKISMAFIREASVEVDDGEGMITTKIITDYDWIDIFPQKRYLLIKTRPHSNNYIVNEAQSKQDFEYYWELLKNIFKIVYINMSETKNTLYRIFKVLTDKAEAPYSKKVLDNLSVIEHTIKELSSTVELKSSKYPVDIPIRVARLFERSLILSDLINYKAYDKDKLGIVDKIDFSDQSGAKVVALSAEDGIEYADIYFDTRETLDELMKLNKLWVTWFLHDSNEDDTSSHPEENVESREQDGGGMKKVETRFEVYDNRVVLQFLEIQCAPKEVQEHVLSVFRKFEEGEIS